jgi:Flp pilus assembly protein TadD
MPPPSQTAPAQAAPLLAVAAQLLRAGRPADAVPPLREAARLAPGNASILHDLGLACLECGLTGEAINALQGAVAAQPRYADAHLRLGIALEAAGALDEALAAYAMASTVLPSLADARYRAASLLNSLGRQAEAAATFRRAAASAPKTSLGRISAARALLAENRDEEARKILRQALALDKDNAVALDLLGNSLADAGLFDEARSCFERAIERAPPLAGSYYDIVRCSRITPDDSGLIARMQEALALPVLEPAQLSRVHLALGKAADDLGDYAVAMRHYDAASAIRDAISGFDLKAFERLVVRVIACSCEAGTPQPRRSASPIMIIGLPRSGTTLVEQILSAHPAVAAGGELPFWNERGMAWERTGSLAWDAAFLAGAAADYASVLHDVAPGAARITDKMPLNFLWAGMICCAVPDAMIVHVRRNAVATALSIHQTHFNPRMNFPTGGAALVGYVGAYERLAAHWRRMLPPERYVELEYETLVTAPEPAIRQLISCCGLAWNEACLRPELNRRSIKTPSKWQARQVIHDGAVDKWRAYEHYLGELRGLLQ